MKLIKKLWVKFNGMDIKCFCNENDRKCRDEECREYVVRFIEIVRSKPPIIKLDNTEQQLKQAIRKLKKSETELSKTINKFKIR